MLFRSTVPPLRERLVDIPALTRHFLARFAAEERKRIRLITPEALQVLSTFRWPGNIRQLENTLFRAVVLAEGDTIGQSEFPQIATQVSGQPAEQPLVPDFSHGEISNAEMPLAALEIEPTAATAVAPAMPAADALPLLGADGEVRPLEELETELIRYAITHYRGQMSEVARRLRIGRSTLYRKLEALGLNTEQEELDSEGVAG